MGAFSFLRKPIAQDELIAIIRVACQGRAVTPKAVAVCLPDAGVCKDLEAGAAKLLAEGIDILRGCCRPAEAVAYVITEAPALILMDTEMADATCLL